MSEQSVPLCVVYRSDVIVLPVVRQLRHFRQAGGREGKVAPAVRLFAEIDRRQPVSAPDSTVTLPASTDPASVEQRLAATAPGPGFLAPHRPCVGGSRDCMLASRRT